MPLALSLYPKHITAALFYLFACFNALLILEAQDLLHSLPSSLSTTRKLTNSEANGPILESNGIAVFEAESGSFDGSLWSLETAISGYSGSGYLVGKINTYNDPGRGAIRYPIRISASGRYQLAWKSRITAGTSNTDANDSFARLLDESGDPLSLVPNDNHSHTLGWHKVYMNRFGSWIYDASNKDNDPHSLSWNLEAGNTYFFELSVRSKDHAIDRIVLWDTALHAYASKLTGKQSQVAALDAIEPSPRENEPLLDSDSDGIPDYWEALHSDGPTSLLPNSDPDRDGQSTMLEFGLGTNPNSFTPPPAINVHKSGSSTYYQLNYTLSSEATEFLDLKPSYSTDLVQWISEDLTIEKAESPNEPGLATVQAEVQSDIPKPALYFRITAQKKQSSPQSNE